MVASLYGLVVVAWAVASNIPPAADSAAQGEGQPALPLEALAFAIVTAGLLYALIRRLTRGQARELERFTTFAHAASDWLWETDADHRMVHISSGRAHQVGESNEQVIGKTRWEYAGAAPEAAPWRDHIAALERREPFQDFVYEVEVGGAGTRVMRTSGQPVFAGSGRFLGYRGVARDITADLAVRDTLRETERDLVASHRRLAALLDALPAEIALVDGVGTVVDVNAGWKRAVDAEGRAGAGHGLGRPYVEVCRIAGAEGDDADAVRAALERVLAGGEGVTDLEYADGAGDEPRWFRVAIVPVAGDGLDGAVVAQFEITARKRAERRLAEREERFRILSDLASDVAFAYSVGGDGGLYREWVFGSGAREWSRMLPKRIDPENGLPPLADPEEGNHRRRLRRLLAGESVNDDIRIDGDGDEEHWIRLGAWPRTDEQDSRVIEIVGSMKDISDLKIVEGQLAHAQKLEAVGQLTGGIAHDFNNLLTVILGNAEEIASTPGESDPSVREAAAMIERAGQRGVELTRHLLAFSRRQPLAPQRIEMAEMLGAQKQLLDRALGETVAVDIDAPDGLWPIQADPAQLEAALLNIAVNSRDAMPGGGTLTIAARNLPTEAAGERPASLASGDYVCIAVSDTGSGMPSHVQQRVFEPFFTTKEVGEGTGLGLSMVYGFARQSGGLAAIDSQPDEGTTVRLYLPRHAEDAASPDEAGQPAAPRLEAGSETVLVVEDQLLVLDSVAKMVGRLGYTVLSASNADEALHAVDTRPEIDLIFSDLLMPGEMSGIDLIREARQRRPDLKALLTTGYSQRLARNDSDWDVPVLYKPYRLGELSAALRRALNE